MDKRTPSEIEEILCKFLYQMPRRSQTEAAKRLGINKQDFNNYYNGRYNPPDRLLMMMVNFLHTRGIYLQGEEIAQCDNFKKLSHSERANYARKDEKWRKKRSGRPPKKSLEIIRHGHDELTKKNRTDDELAKKYYFTSRFTLHIAILVVENGCLALIQKMDDGSISFEYAAKVAKLPGALQTLVLNKGKKGIIAYFAAQEDKHTSITKLLHIAKKHPGFRKAQTETQIVLETLLTEILYEGRALLK